MNITINLHSASKKPRSEKKDCLTHKEKRTCAGESEGQMDPNRLRPVRDPGRKTKTKLEPLDTKIKRPKVVSTRVLLT